MGGSQTFDRNSADIYLEKEIVRAGIDTHTPLIERQRVGGVDSASGGGNRESDSHTQHRESKTMRDEEKAEIDKETKDIPAFVVNTSISAATPLTLSVASPKLCENKQTDTYPPSGACQNHADLPSISATPLTLTVTRADLREDWQANVPGSSGSECGDLSSA